MNSFAERRLGRLSARVGRGAALLDAEMPGWESRIDLDRLDVAHQEDCPLGQICGDYRRGVEFLVLWPWEEASHGFHAGCLSRLVGAERRDLRSLTLLWAAEVLARRRRSGAGRVVAPPKSAATSMLI